MKIFQNRGFMIVEILIAISIITVVILAMMVVAQKSIYVSRQAVDATEATFLLEEGAEAVRILRDNNWTNISGLTASANYYPLFAGGTWTLSSTPNTVDIFTRKVSVAAVLRDNATKDVSVSGTNDPGTKLVTVTVSWVEGGTTVTKTLSFYILDIFS
jgi:type II secretory pathway pseudopilin PulG